MNKILLFSSLLEGNRSILLVQTLLPILKLVVTQADSWQDNRCVHLSVHAAFYCLQILLSGSFTPRLSPVTARLELSAT